MWTALATLEAEFLAKGIGMSADQNIMAQAIELYYLGLQGPSDKELGELKVQCVKELNSKRIPVPQLLWKFRCVRLVAGSW